MPRSAMSIRYPGACVPLMLVVCALGLLLSGPAAAQLRVANYNVASLDGDLNALQGVFEELGLDDRPGYAIFPHVIVFQEVKTGEPATILGRLNSAATPYGVSYSAGTYSEINQDSWSGAQAMFYRGDVVQEDAAAYDDIFTGAGRHSSRWKIELLGYEAPLPSFYIYSMHLKASTGGANEQLRLDGVENVRADADVLADGTHIIYAGDFNFYHNGEPGYLYYFTAGNGHAVDPLGTGSWGGAGNAIKHSQSPRDTARYELVGGGMDDRFDFQLSTDEFHDDFGLSIMSGAYVYRSVGNDGNHYDIAINDGDNFYYPGDLPRSNRLADDLFDASDHVPVSVDYRVPARPEAAMDSNYGRVMQFAVFDVELALINAADVVTINGSYTFSYSAFAGGGLSGSDSGSLFPLGPADYLYFPLDTSLVGTRGGGVQIDISGAGVEPDSIIRTTTGLVLSASNPSFASGADTNVLDIPWVVDPDTGVQNMNVEVHNYGYTSTQGLLDVDSVTGDAPPVLFIGGLASDVGFTPATLSFALDTTGLASGTFQTDPISINTSDEDVPGEGADAIALTFSITVNGGACPEDLDGLNGVGQGDLNAVLNRWGDPACDPGGAANPCPEDLDGLNGVGQGDLNAVLNRWGDPECEPPGARGGGRGKGRGAKNRI